MPVDNDVGPRRARARSPMLSWCTIAGSSGMPMTVWSGSSAAGRCPFRIGRGLAPVRIELPIEPPAAAGDWRAPESSDRIHPGPRALPGPAHRRPGHAGAQRRYRENVADLTRLFGVRARSRGPRRPSRLFHDALRGGDGTALPRRPASSRPRSWPALPSTANSGPALGIAWDGTGLWRRWHDLGR